MNRYRPTTLPLGSTKMTSIVQKRKANIQYPMAYQPVFDVTHIGDAERGVRYLCLGCKAEMIPRMGRIKRHHFAHKAGQEQCNPDNALHETAKAAICLGFLSAVQLGKEYFVRFPCSRCHQPIEVNVAGEGAAIATERSVVQGTRSDLVITKGDGISPRLIVEIVVHHDVEESTEEIYRESGTAVIKIRPAWETVDNLREQIFADDILNVDDTTCRGCKDTDRRHREWLGGIEGKLNNAISAGHEGQGRLTPITQDRFGSYLRSDTKRRVNTNAGKLAAAGFRQQPKRPTLFRVDVDGWRIFADLDSTEVMKIWEVDCLPGFYAFPEDTEPPRCKECVLDIVRGILERNGVEIRRYFLDHGTHNHWTPDDDEGDRLFLFQ